MLRLTHPAAVALLAAHAAASAQPVPQPTLKTHRLTSTVNAYGSFSPDDKTIVFQSNATGRWQLYTIRASGDGLAPLLTSPGNDITPVFSPDGTHILFVSERDGNREVYVCNADGSAQKNLSANAEMDIHPSWSHDGTRILFSSNRGNPDPEDYDIYQMNADGSGVTQLTRGPEIDTYASWSPDGSSIVTRRVIDNHTNNEVFVLGADGSNPRNLTNAPQHYDGWPVWSPDGKRICFAGGGPDNGNHYLFLINPDGTGKQQLTFPWIGEHCYDTQPSFSHDGKHILFTRYRPPSQFESAELVILDLPSPA